VSLLPTALRNGAIQTLRHPIFNHQYHVRTIKNLHEQAQALLVEADKINERDKMVRHELESHVQCYDFKLYAISSLYSRSVLSKI
jgi:hypothetical protein